MDQLIPQGNPDGCPEPTDEGPRGVHQLRLLPAERRLWLCAETCGCLAQLPAHSSTQDYMVKEFLTYSPITLTDEAEERVDLHLVAGHHLGQGQVLHLPLHHPPGDGAGGGGGPPDGPEHLVLARPAGAAPRLGGGLHRPHRQEAPARPPQGEGGD